MKGSVTTNAHVDKNDLIGLNNLKSGALIASKGLKIRYRKINGILTPMQIDNDDIDDGEK